MKECFCIGPQNGEPRCPCRMKGIKAVDGRWIETIDHGPVKPAISPEDYRSLLLRFNYDPYGNIF